MKTFSKLPYLVMLASLITLGSCSEDDDKDPPKSATELIGSGEAWKFSSASAGGIPITSAIPACFLDNQITFDYNESGNTGVVDAGANKCSESEPQTADFEWSYSESTSILTVDTELLDIPGATGDIKVVSVTADTLVLTQSVAITGLGPQEVTLTLVH
ncbi:lipocalin family protein [Algoriphagus sp. Y33]|uniref:lipocalin family protein n=1 Tax=Algoriphagus sp. Y33 TaxID=2772483 RepID=UPI00177B96B5|nr:lipocalin family protein [Algoriphagus sp. Y33]